MKRAYFQSSDAASRFFDAIPFNGYIRSFDPLPTGGYMVRWYSYY